MKAPPRPTDTEMVIYFARELRDWFLEKECQLSATDGPIPRTLDTLNRNERRIVEGRLAELFDAVEVYENARKRAKENGNG